jgi:hypothetical protein
VPYRRIGTILVDRQLITGRQLEQALAEQQQTGRPLGEICVDRYGLDRLSLADALAEQWEEMQRAAPVEQERAVTPGPEDDIEESAAEDVSAEDELRVLLGEAQAARHELTVKTDELGKRLAALEALVVGVSDALAELRPGGSHAGQSARNHPPRNRAGTRHARRRAAS